MVICWSHVISINSGIARRMQIYKQLADILRSANLRQHVQERTHRHGHTDLAISRDDDNLIKDVSVSSIPYLLLLVENQKVRICENEWKLYINSSTLKIKHMQANVVFQQSVFIWFVVVYWGDTPVEQLHIVEPNSRLSPPMINYGDGDTGERYAYLY